MFAASAAKRNKRVAIVDHANKAGKKILMSGGGRCNFTNLDTGPEHFISANPHFCKSALNRYTPYHFMSLVDEYHLKYVEKAEGQYFCANKASDLLQILLDEIKKPQVSVYLKTTIESIAKVGKTYHVKSDSGEHCFQSPNLIVATGGLSIPMMGASSFGYEIAKQFGHTVLPTVASLVPFVFSDAYKSVFASLSGVSLLAEVSVGAVTFKENVLFSHRGLTGPAILQISNYWESGRELNINFLPDVNITHQFEEWRKEKNKASLVNLLAGLLPKKFVSLWLEHHGLSNDLHQLSKKDVEKYKKAFNNWCATPAGTEGYRTAEVTRGGINTNEVSSRTFESQKSEGLYFIGEVLDVTGWLGGYNFQWAWSSAWCAAQAIE